MANVVKKRSFRTARKTSKQDEENLLESIQEAFRNISQENSKLKEDVAELKASLNSNQLKALKEALASTTKQNTELRKELKSTKKQLQEQIDETYGLVEALNNLENTRGRNSVQVHGVSQENAFAWTEDAVIKVTDALNIPVVPEDTKTSHQLKRPNSSKPKPKIVKLCSHKVKTQLYKQHPFTAAARKFLKSSGSGLQNGR